jgi:hypothetical protein
MSTTITECAAKEQVRLLLLTDEALLLAVRYIGNYVRGVQYRAKGFSHSVFGPTNGPTNSGFGTHSRVLDSVLYSAPAAEYVFRAHSHVEIYEIWKFRVLA